MTLQIWLLFVAMSFVVSATPGPNMLLVMSTGARVGLRGAMATMAGCMSALLAMLTLSAAGLGAVLLAAPTLFDALRLIGAAYLAWLGIALWRAPVAAPDAELAEAPAAARGAAPTHSAALYRQGVLVAASNPKAILFAAAFFPQFLRADAPQGTQLAILLLTFAVIEVAWYFVYALSGRQLATHLRRPAVMRWFNRVTGGVFVGFALAMARLR